MRFSIMVVAFVLALAANAWAQGSKPSTLAELAKYNGADRERILYEGAKKEGKLLWYTSLVPNKHIAKVFQAKYPGIAVDVYRAAGNTLATRLLEERRAKRYLADAIESTPPQLMLLRDAQALQPFLSPHLANYPDVAKESASGDLGFLGNRPGIFNRRRLQHQRYTSGSGAEEIRRPAQPVAQRQDVNGKQ